MEHHGAFAGHGFGYVKGFCVGVCVCYSVGFFNLVTACLLFCGERKCVELEVKTNDDNVDIEADKTKTTTIPIKTSGKVASIVGIIVSYFTD